jgi:hypothetical protein
LATRALQNAMLALPDSSRRLDHFFLARSTCADFFGHGQINRLLSESDGWALTKKVVHSNIGVDLQGFAHKTRSTKKQFNPGAA